ncbi:glycosyltransferase family 4 protein [Rhodovarius crocodyli]|nr:glycosyltransferase family 4 protein [Rhodovarius crocodyli]
MSFTVLQVLPALQSGGVERGALEIAEAILAAGGRALVASAGGRLVPALEAMGATHITLPLDAKWRIAGNATLLARVIREHSVDIVHARSRAPAWSALLAARRTGARFVTTWHGTYSENFPGKRLYNSVMARGERVIAISRFIEGHVLARHPWVAQRLRLVPRGADTALFDPAAVPPDRVAAMRAGWGGEGPFVLLPARLSRWKGQSVLIEALGRLGRPATAVLLGDGRAAYREELVAQAAAAGADVVFPGHVSDMPAALLAADLVVHASTQAEAFGRSVIEGQAMGRIVLAADLGGPRETVEDGRTGFLTPAGDAPALAAALRRALDMPPEARAAMGRAAREAVVTRFSKTAMQNATLAVYRELL